MAYEKFTGEEYIDTDLVAKLNQDFDACGKLAGNNTWSADNDFTAGLTVNKTPTVNADVSNKKYVDDSIAEGTVYRSKSTITHPLQITEGNTIGQLKEAIVTLANKIKLLSQVTGCIGYFTCAETWADNWTNDDFVLEEGQMWSVEIVSINSYSEGYWVARITSYSEKSCYIVSYTNLIWGNLHKYAFLTDVTSAVANLLSSNNTWTGSNTYRKRIAVSNGTAAGSQGQVIFGVKPSTATVQANIISSTTGALNYIATENTGHYFKIGNNTASTSITTDKGEAAIFSHNALEFARITNVGVAKWLGNANTATKLATARAITANLASSTAGSFDGSANITVGVTGTLPIANGGTGLTSAPSMLVNLASTTATSPLQASPRPGVTGTLPIANGGTGQTTAAGVRNALGLGNTTGAVPIANGGTGATTAAAARTALGCAPAYTYSTTDLTAGSSALTTGTLYIVYE